MSSLETKIYKASEFAKKLGIHIRTLYNWEKNGQLKPFKIVNTHRYYSQDQLDKYLADKFGVEPKKTRKNIGYSRVSSKKQSDDLEKQIEILELYLTAKGKPFEIITDIGSGLDYGKKGLQQLLEKVMNNEVDTVVVTYQDRLIRFGSSLLEQVFEKFNTTLEVINTSVDKIDGQELVDDIAQLLITFSGQLHGDTKEKVKGAIGVLKDEN